MKPSTELIASTYQKIQSEICDKIAKIDGKENFKTDHWTRAEGGGGISRVLENGNVWEKAGVNFSAVHGHLPENIKNALKISGTEFYATGVSIVMHPHNPFVPIIHMNIRYFEIGGETYWFGGGIDLTPHYIYGDDAKLFHQALKKTCDTYDLDFYPKFKQWADDYFYIKHREETRGIGGIFYDRLYENDRLTKEDLFNFSCDLGNLFPEIYGELVEKNRNKAYNEKHKDFQMLRRGRYVEFNLVYDKGTKFGLDTSGRIESILMSLPYRAGWKYNYEAEPNSKEAETLALLKKGINWV